MNSTVEKKLPLALLKIISFQRWGKRKSAREWHLQEPMVALYTFRIRQVCHLVTRTRRTVSVFGEGLPVYPACLFRLAPQHNLIGCRVPAHFIGAFPQVSPGRRGFRCEDEPHKPLGDRGITKRRINTLSIAHIE